MGPSCPYKDPGRSLHSKTQSNNKPTLGHMFGIALIADRRSRAIGVLLGFDLPPRHMGKFPIVPKSSFKTQLPAGLRWLTPVILVTWEAEIRRIIVQGQPCPSFPKTTRARRARSPAQAASRVPVCKHETLSEIKLHTRQNAQAFPGAGRRAGRVVGRACFQRNRGSWRPWGTAACGQLAWGGGHVPTGKHSGVL
jgi:hypothetical protein